jgi:hypothetical protein
MASDFSTVKWRKSSRSGQDENSECVELAAIGRQVAVRDSKDPDGPKLMLTASEWSTLSARLKDSDQA